MRRFGFSRILCLCAGLITAIVLNSASVNAGILNGSFEDPSIGPWTVFGPSGQVTPSFDGVLPTDGVKMALIETRSGALPTFILDLILNNALGVGSGYLASAFPNAVEGALLYQSFTLAPGESVISFNWNFLTNEGTPSVRGFNDFAFAHLISGGSLVDSAIVDTFASFPDSGVIYREHTGWNTVAFSGLAPGSYSLVFGVFDADDGNDAFASALLVDSVVAVPEPSSLALLGLAFGAFSGRRRRG
jgi:hypothetical protein